MKLTLGQDDRRAVDLLLDRTASVTGNGNGHSMYAGAESAIGERIAGAQRLLRLLELMPQVEPPQDLVSRTFAISIARRTAKMMGPQLAPAYRHAGARVIDRVIARMSRSTSSSVWRADSERSRLVPRSTVGGRIATVKIPSFISASAAFNAADSVVMPIGMIGESPAAISISWTPVHCERELPGPAVASVFAAWFP